MGFFKKKVSESMTCSSLVNLGALRRRVKGAKFKNAIGQRPLQVRTRSAFIGSCQLISDYLLCFSASAALRAQKRVSKWPRPTRGARVRRSSHKGKGPPQKRECLVTVRRSRNVSSQP